ncbi:Hypothetical protein PBC10988_41440 [Planctomycetales bacterium 10988]|nr:Hypothetical protein PBC10988_41440 [Planctomycetales bacterium 10988]
MSDSNKKGTSQSADSQDLKSSSSKIGLTGKAFPTLLLTWHSSAPTSVKSITEFPLNTEEQTAWCHHLQTRRSARLPDPWQNPPTSPLLWAWPVEGDWLKNSEETGKELQSILSYPDTAQLLAEQLHNKEWKLFLSTKAVATHFKQPLLRAYQALALAYHLPELCGKINSVFWWQLFGNLIAFVQLAEDQTLQQRHPLAHQLLAGELPLVIAYLFPEIKNCRDLLNNLDKVFDTRGTDVLLDGSGLPHGQFYHFHRGLLACWTRSRYLDEGTGRKSWNASAADQYQLMVREMLRWSRADGHPILGKSKKEKYARDWIKYTLDITANDEDRAIANLHFGGSDVAPTRHRSKKPRSEAFNHSEWAGLTLMRGDWNRSSVLFALNYHQSTFRTEFIWGHQSFWQGEEVLTLSIEGKELSPQTEWEPTCWYEDEEVQYLEIEAPFSETIRVQRQFVFAPKDGFLLMGDAILSEEVGKFHYKRVWPISSGVVVNFSSQHQDFQLSGAQRQARVLPLGIPEWKSDRTKKGTVHVDEKKLELTYETESSRFFLPIWFDYSQTRIQVPLTWRKLTVAESLQVVGEDTAVGYRIQIGKKQWLLYRSLINSIPRTVLGQHLENEFLVARFSKKGTTETIVEIEANKEEDEVDDSEE